MSVHIIVGGFAVNEVNNKDTLGGGESATDA